MVTSPPYFGLRSYSDSGTTYAGQLGSESSLEEFLKALLDCTREMIRVLKPSGSIWVNLGDKYNGYNGGRKDGTIQKNGPRPVLPTGSGLDVPSMPNKTLVGIPWRYALRCIDELGLILRAEVIWAKPNGMPEILTDRVRRSHETWFHFTKQPRYYASKEAARASSVWDIATQPLIVPESLGIKHFAAFPMELPFRIISGWCPPDGVVLDPFGGTGTTAIVAKTLGRHAISIDMSSDYLRLAKWRSTDPKQIAKAESLKGQTPMGNTLDMAKIKEDHQARTQRICDAARNFESPGSWPEVLALALMELAAIWREEANRLSELPSPKPRGWKTTMESLRDCATRVSGVAVAMRNHGLPGDDSGPKPSGTTAGASTPENGAAPVGPTANGDDADPKELTGTTSPSLITSPPTASAFMGNGASTAPGAVSEDPAGDFLRDLGRKPNAGDWTSIDGLSKLAPAPGGGLIVLNDPNPDESLAEAAASIIKQVRTRVTDHSGAQFDVTHSPDTTVTANQFDTPHGPETFIQLEAYGNSDGALDTSPQPDQNTMTVTWRDGVKTTVGVVPQAGHEVIAPGAFGEGGTVPLTLGIGGPVIGEAQWSIGAADAPPAWTALPAVEVIELDAVPTLPSPGHTSVSQANMVSECALKWKLAKRHGAPERPGWALVGGKAFHECVAALETGSEPLYASSPASLWREMFKRAIAQTEAENPLFPQDTWHASNKGKENRAWWDADGPEMVHRYLEWRAKWIADGWELLHTQDGRPVVELEFLAFLGGSPVKGFIDSAWYHPGRNMIAIVDWKSGTSKPADYFQQATYRHALEPLLAGRAWGDVSGRGSTTSWPTTLGAFWDARKGELGPLVDLDVRHPKAEVELRLSMPRRIDAAGLYMPNVNTGYGGCGSCSLKRSCPVGSRIGTGEVNL